MLFLAQAIFSIWVWDLDPDSLLEVVLREGRPENLEPKALLSARDELFEGIFR